MMATGYLQFKIIVYLPEMPYGVKSLNFLSTHTMKPLDNLLQDIIYFHFFIYFQFREDDNIFLTNSSEFVFNYPLWQ